MGLARAIARLFHLGYYDASGGFQEGQVAIFGSAAFQAALPSWQAAQLPWFQPGSLRNLASLSPPRTT